MMDMAMTEGAKQQTNQLQTDKSQPDARPFALPSVSVIVPCYNVAEFLPECLESILAQGIDMEVILVDDGSTDSTGGICEEYAARDRRFRVIHKENGGLSSARNAGLEIASGEYICFIDSDDFLEAGCLERVLTCAVKYDADLVMFPYWILEGSTKTSPKDLPDKESLCTAQEAWDIMLGGVGRYAWNKFYRRELFKGIRYPEGRRFEDKPVTYRLIAAAERICCIPDKLYYYRQRAGSISVNKSYPYLLDDLEMTILEYHGMKKAGYVGDKLEMRIRSLVLHYCIVMGAQMPAEDRAFAEKILREPEYYPKEFPASYRFMLYTYRHMRPVFELASILSGKRRKF